MSFLTLSDGRTFTQAQVAKLIDHAILRPDQTDDDVRGGCDLAVRCGVWSVCVKPCHVSLAAELLKGTEVSVCTVIGYPHGSTTTAVKVFEAREAISNGAIEIDMVINIGTLRGGDTAFVREEIALVVAASEGRLVKVILENAYLTDEQKVVACQIAQEAGAQFVKTSTGFATSGATVEDVRLMKSSVGCGVQVKASGGIRSLDDLKAMVEAGATRIGTSSTAAILDPG